jgi:hypothetical protein
MLPLQAIRCKLRTAISLLAILLTVRQQPAAQLNTLFIKPYLGFQQPFSKKLFSEIAMGDFKNNRLWLIPTYGFRAEYVRKRFLFLFEFLNGQAGYNSGVNHRNYCRQLNFGGQDTYKGGAANNYRFVFGYGRLLGAGHESKKFWVKKMMATGISFDIRSSEDLNAGRFETGGYNSCGIYYTFPDTAYNIKNIGWGIPIMLDLKTFFRSKPFLALQVFLNIGLTRRFTTDFLYKTPTDTKVSRVVTRGTVIGVVVSCPIKIWQQKRT